MDKEEEANRRLSHAAARGQTQVVRDILRENPDMVVEDNAINNACMMGYDAVVQELLTSKHAKPEENSFITACKRGYHKCVALLLNDKRFDPLLDEKNEAVIGAALKGHVDVLKVLHADGRVNVKEGAPYTKGDAWNWYIDNGYLRK
jgi:hypothetical protein